MQRENRKYMMQNNGNEKCTKANIIKEEIRECKGKRKRYENECKYIKKCNVEKIAKNTLKNNAKEIEKDNNKNVNSVFEPKNKEQRK